MCQAPCENDGSRVIKTQICSSHILLHHYLYDSRNLSGTQGHPSSFHSACARWISQTRKLQRGVFTWRALSVEMLHEHTALQEGHKTKIRKPGSEYAAFPGLHLSGQVFKDMPFKHKCKLHVISTSHQPVL